MRAVAEVLAHFTIENKETHQQRLASSFDPWGKSPTINKENRGPDMYP